MENTISISTPDFSKTPSPKKENKVVLDFKDLKFGNYFFVRRLIDQDCDVEKNWKEVWEKDLMRDGQVDVERLKRELFDYGFLIQEASKVYRHVTGGRVKGVAHLAEKVIESYSEHLKIIKDEEVNKH